MRDLAERMKEDLKDEPTPLSFFGQIDLAAIRESAPLAGWPSEGMLAFFYDSTQGAWGFDPAVRGHCRVFYFPVGTRLAPVKPPSKGVGLVFPARAVSFDLEWTLPNFISDVEALRAWREGDYQDLCTKLMGDRYAEPSHRCGGHPQPVQVSDMALECQLVTNGIYLGDATGHQTPQAKALAPGASDWRLLLQVDTDEERMEWMFGDAGRVYFWARQQDIAACDFAQAWAILQCY